MYWVGLMNNHEKTETITSSLISTTHVSNYSITTQANNNIFVGPTQMAKLNDYNTLRVGYDYDSVMHYSTKQCSWYSYWKLSYQPSMTFTKKFKGNADDVGQRAKLSDKDIQHINAMFCASELIIINCAVIHIY